LLKHIANLFPPEQFPDGVVFVDGEWEALAASGLDGVVQSVFEALFESDPPLKVSISTARTYLGSVKPLILLDHLALPREAWSKLPDLFPAGGLIWSMTDFPPSQVAHELPLSGLPPEEAYKLFLLTSEISPTDADSGNLQQICAKLDHHPLAIVTVGGWMHTGRISLPELMERFSTQASPGKNANEPALAVIVAALAEPEGELLSLLASSGGPVLDRRTLIQVSSLEPPAAETALNKLQETGLVQADGAGVSMHPVHKAIVRKLLPANNVQRGRLAEAILSYVIAHQGQPDTVRSQLGNLLGVLEDSLQAGKLEWAGIAARLAAPQLVLSGKWDLWRDTFQRISYAAQLSGDKAQLSRALHELGTHQLAIGDQTEAVRLLTQARDMRLQNGDPVGAAYSQHNLNLLLGPPPSQPPGPKTISPSSRFPIWMLIGGIALFSLIALGAILGASFLNRLSPPPIAKASPTSAIALINDPEQPPAPPPINHTPTSTLSPSPIPTTAPTSSATPTPTASATPPPTPTATFTQTPSSTPTRSPTPFPDPYGYIVFASNRAGNNELYLKRADGAGDPRPLTRMDGNDRRPDLPLQGDRIAFVHNDSNDDNREIYYTDGATTYRIPGSSRADENNPDWYWSPNGMQIAYQSNEDGDMEIWVFNLRSGTAEPLTENDDRDVCPDWSPDGSQIAFSSDRNGNGDEDIFVMNSAGRGERSLWEHPAQDNCPSWSLDGDLIAFLSDRREGNQIWIMNADGTGEPWQLTHRTVVEGPVSWSPDGNWIAFTSTWSNDATDDRDIHFVLVSQDIEHVIRFTGNSAEDVYPVWIEDWNIDFTINPPSGPVN